MSKENQKINRKKSTTLFSTCRVNKANYKTMGRLNVNKTLRMLGFTLLTQHIKEEKNYKWNSKQLHNYTPNAVGYIELQPY